MILLAELLLEVPLELLVQLAAKAHGSRQLVADDLHVHIAHVSIEVSLVGVVVPSVYLLSGCVDQPSCLVPVEPGGLFQHAVQSHRICQKFACCGYFHVL